MKKKAERIFLGSFGVFWLTLFNLVLILIAFAIAGEWTLFDSSIEADELTIVSALYRAH